MFVPQSVDRGDTHTILELSKYGHDPCKRKRKFRVTVRNSDNHLSCTCGSFESQWWPCVHMFCALKRFQITSIPEVMLKKRWAWDVNFGTADDHASIPVSTTQLQAMRFGSLRSRIYQLCEIAAQRDDLYKIALTEIESTICRLGNDTKTTTTNTGTPNRRRSTSANADNQGPSIVRDPEVVRTKGSSQPEPNTSERRKRRYRGCREPGHNRSNCPKSKKSKETDNEIHNNADQHGHQDDIFY